MRAVLLDSGFQVSSGWIRRKDWGVLGNNGIYHPRSQIMEGGPVGQVVDMKQRKKRLACEFTGVICLEMLVHMDSGPGYIF